MKHIINRNKSETEGFHKEQKRDRKIDEASRIGELDDVIRSKKDQGSWEKNEKEPERGQIMSDGTWEEDTRVGVNIMWTDSLIWTEVRGKMGVDAL